MRRNDTSLEYMPNSPVNLVANPGGGSSASNRESGTHALGQATGSLSNNWRQRRGPERYEQPDDFNVWNNRGRGGPRSLSPRGSTNRGGNLRGRGFNPPTRGGEPRGGGRW